MTSTLDVGLMELGQQHQSPAAIECRRVVKSYGSGKNLFRANDDVDIYIPRGTM
jgi:hypothetical protein